MAQAEMEECVRRRYVVPAEVQLVRLAGGLFATTPLGVTGFTGGSLELLEELVAAAAVHGTEEAILAALEEDHEGEVIRQCLTRLTQRGVLVLDDGAFGSLTVDPRAHGESGYLPTYLNGDTFADERRLAQIRDPLVGERLVAIRNAFDPVFAEAVYRHLDQVAHWNHSVAHERDFQFSYQDMTGVDLPPSLKSLWAAMLGTRSRAWMEALCGRPCDGEVEVTSSWYPPFGYVTPHTDGGKNRSIALVSLMSLPSPARREQGHPHVGGRR